MTAATAPMGQELACAILDAAARRGLKLADFVKPLSPNPSQWVSQLRAAKVPKPETVARIRALIAGEPIPPAPPNNFQSVKPTPPKPAALTPHVVSPSPPAPDPETIVDRSPCWRCGTRGDVGCQHQQVYA